jgi:integrase
MYNVDIKRQFLNGYPASTQHVYGFAFRKSEPLETELGKDIYDLKIGELRTLFEAMKPQSISTARTFGRIVSAYIAWTIHEGLRMDGKNPLEEVDNSFFDQFVDESNVLPYFTYDELRKVELFCENAQDAVILRLLFESVQGKEYAELRNLTEDDIDWDNKKVTLYNSVDGDKEYSRTIEVSDIALKLMDDALSEATYYKRNGQIDAPSNVRPFTDLVNNNFVIRSSVTRTDSFNKPVDKYVILRRIAMIAETYGIPNLNAKNIVRTGMIYMGYNLLQQHGKLDKDAYKKIAERFKVNTMAALKEIVNENTIRKLYEI